MSLRWRSVLLACAAATTVLGSSLAGASSPAAQAQSAPTGGSGDSSCPSSNPPNELMLSGGTPQTAQLGVGFANPLQVELANSNGCPITTTTTGTPITFTAPTSGPSATFAASGSTTLTVGSDATGSASVQMLAANDIAGTYSVTASSAYGTVSFSLTNTAAGVPATITALAPGTRRATVDSRYAQPLAVRVLDANGDPVAGASVTFSLGAGGGGNGGSASAAAASFDDGTAQATAVTGPDGVATSPGFRANSTSGGFSATASVEHVEEPARFVLDNLAPRLQMVGPSRSRTAAIGTRYAHRLRVAVRDAAGSPVVGAAVTFTLGSGSAGSSAAAGATFTGGATELTVTTGQRGIATSPRLTANEQAGSWTAKADVGGAGAAVLFHLRNRAGRPASLVAGIGATQSTDTGTRFAIALAVTVSDGHGNHASNVPVTFSAPPSGPGATFAGGRRTVTVMTSASGIAVAPPLTANADAGGYIVTASVKGVRPVAFALVNTSA